MTGHTPNQQQQKLIQNTEGICLADAGPGTGKTFTISLRYAHILENKKVDPDDILLITFTNNAAENMKERIINLSDYEQSELRDAPISTFHSYCNKILNRYGHEAPKIIGIDDMITQSTTVIENEVLELQEFETFMGDFREKHPEYDDFYSILYDDSDLLNLIKSLGAKGIFPTKEGWFRNSERYLDGDIQEFVELFEDANEPLPGTHGPKQSELKSRLTGYKNKCFLPDAPSQKEIRGDDNQIPPEYAELCFEEDRTELKQFVHDVYFEYIEYALSRNYLNFSFMMMLAFALLCEDHDLRKKLSFEYVMIDEFQDTNEIQFKLALLLSKNGNICVVGDWKQSIFSFQYASVENIIEFEERLNEFKEDLNTDYERVDYPTEIKEEIPLKKNYRSTQDIIDFSEQGLLVEATKQETIDKDDIRSKIIKLKSVNNGAQTEIGAYIGEDEKGVILSKITDIVDNPDYTILENDRERTIEYGDIAVLTRTRKFGLRLMKEAEDHNIPVAYEGGIELFRTRPSLILLAWLRIVQNKHSKRGWSLILDEAGYTLNEIEQIFKNRSYPDNLYNFRSSLEREETIGSLAKKVFEKYSIKNAFSDKIIETIQTTYENTYFNRSDMINFIVDNIESKQTYEVDSTADDDVFKIQTIHSSKGLEYPVVVLADMSTGGGGFGGAIDYKEPLGLRQSKIFSNEPYPYSYDNWKKYVMSKCLTGDYDEERRLLYVAMTRAENYLFLTAEKESESEFFKNLSIEPKEIELDIQPSLPKKEKRTELIAEQPKVHAPVKYSAHAIIDNSEFEIAEEGLGKEYGTKVHRFAELYAEGEDIEPTNQDEKNVKRFIDSLDGELLTEKNCLLPLDINDKRILFQGIIDLIHINDNKVQVIDFKTDRDKNTITEYRKQISIYKKVVEVVHPEKNIESYVFYTEDGNLTQIEPMNLKEINQSLRT